MQAVPQARRSGLPSSVCGDFPDFDVLERDCGGRVLLDPFACLLRRIFRFEDDHREPVVLSFRVQWPATKPGACVTRGTTGR